MILHLYKSNTDEEEESASMVGMCGVATFISLKKENSVIIYSR